MKYNIYAKVAMHQSATWVPLVEYKVVFEKFADNNDINDDNNNDDNNNDDDNNDNDNDDE